MKQTGTILIVMILSFLVSCKYEKKNDELNVKKTAEKTNVIKQQQILNIKGKEIKSLTKVLGDSVTPERKVFFLYNGFDCDTCIDIGYEMAKKIDSINKGKLVYIISTSSNIGSDQAKNLYRNFVFNDEADLIRKELKYIYTPVLISLNKNSIVNNVFFPNYIRNKKKENDFIRECITNANFE